MSEKVKIGDAIFEYFEYDLVLCIRSNEARELWTEIQTTQTLDHELDIIDRALRRERNKQREKDAKICEEFYDPDYAIADEDVRSADCADSIRAAMEKEQ